MSDQEKQVSSDPDQQQAKSEESSLLETIIDESGMAIEENQRDAAKEQIQAFVDGFLDKSIPPSEDTDTMINARIAQIDKLISNQLNEILHHPDFQKLEASWRGLDYLVSNSNTGERLKIKVLNVTKKDLISDLKQKKKYDQSELFKKVYEDEFGTPGGEAFGTLIGDYEFSNHPQDIILLKKIAEVAAAAHAPFISAAAPSLLNMRSYTELSNRYKLETIFGKPEYAAWRTFRESEDSRYVSLTLPHTLMRLPYGKDTVVVDSFDYEEEVDGKDHSKYLWGNAAYSLGVRITKAFDKHSWCVAIRGVEGGGLVQDLPSHPFKTDEGDIALKCPTEIGITDRREKELADLGFIPLCYYKNTDYAAFFSLQTTNKPKQYTTDAATANANLSSQLQYILAVSRFAHYLKSMMRDKIGGFMSLEEAGKFLNNWIGQYVCGSDSSESYKAKCPLNEARVDVVDVPGKPGVYKAVAFLKPHFQLDELTISLRLVAELPAPKG